MIEFESTASEQREAALADTARMSIGHVVNTYRMYAPLYDLVFGGVLEPGRRLLAERVCALRPKNLLEVGVGTGLLLGRYPSDTAITGVDVSEEMLHVARRRAERLPNHRIVLHAMDAEITPFADESFDCVTLPYVLSVTPDPAALVSEARRVCRKGGTIFILNHFSGSRFWWLLERAVSPLASRIGFRSTFTLEEQVLNYDWEVLSIESVNLMGLSKLIAVKN